MKNSNSSKPGADKLSARLLNTLPINLILLNARGEVTFFNKAWRKLAKQSGLPEPGLGTPYLSIWEKPGTINPEIRSQIKTNLEDLLRGEKKTFTSEISFFVETQVRSMVLHGHRLSRSAESEILIIHQETVAMESSKQKIRDTGEDVPFALQARASGIWEWDLSTNQIVFSEDSERPLRMDPDMFEPNLQRLLKNLAPKERSAFEDLILTITRKPAPFHHTFQMRIREGERRWFLISGRPVEGAPNGRKKMLGFIVDVTEEEKNKIQLDKNKQWLKSTFEYAPIGIANLNLEGYFIRANPYFCNLIGYSASELTKIRFQDITHPDDREKDLSAWAKLVKGESDTYVTEKRYINKSKQIRWVELSVHLICNQEGQPSYLLSVINDITARKQAEQNLKNRDKILEAVRFAAEQFLRPSRWDRDFNAVLERLGKAARVSRVYVFQNRVDERGELLASLKYEWVDAGIEPQISSPLLQDVPYVGSGFERWKLLMERGEIISGNVQELPRQEQELLRHQKIQSILVVPVYLAEKWWGFLGFDECLRERVWSEAEIESLRTAANILSSAIQRLGYEKALHDSTELYRNLLKTSPDGVVLTDLDTRITEISNQILVFYGGDSAEEIVGRKLEAFVPAEFKEQLRADIRQLLASGTMGGLEYPVLKKTGEFFYGEIYAALLKDLRGSPQGYIITIRDVTKRKQAELQLSRLASVVEQSSDAVLITDLQGNIEYVNRAFEQTSGYSREEVLGKNPRFLKSGSQSRRTYQQLWKTISSGKTWRGTLINKRKNGQQFYEEAIIFPIFDSEGKIINYAAAKRNVTDEKKLEKQLFQAQKMEAIGRLAGGVAHDFNNILTVIQGYGELLYQSVKDQPRECKQLLQIRHAADKAGSLTQQLLAFSRRQVMQSKILSLNDIVSELMKMLQRLIGEDIALSLHLEENLGAVKVDPVQVEQIIMNLAVNARDAMPEGGKLYIETKNVSLDQSFINKHAGAISGQFVRLSITDTGVGMKKEILAHIFEPFFTTKAMGKGTGLGLATVYGIVKQSGGYISVYSEPGEGTTFKIYFPRVDEEIEIREYSEETYPDLSGDETVLVVEDDPSVRDLVTGVLEAYGYNVVVVSDPSTELEKLDWQKLNAQLLITDVIMPQMNGKELARRVREHLPKIRVLFMSGYTVDHLSDQDCTAMGAEFLEKPFHPRELLNRVRRLLNLSG